MKILPLQKFCGLLVGAALTTLAAPASALNILLVNDDGLSANIQAQYDALVAAGHDVVVSIPCQNQSGKGASINFLTPLTALTTACRNGAAPVGAPGVGGVVGKPNYYYVNGTPVMATAYGLDILAPQRWGKAPDLVLSGPNEGQNAGPIVNSSGTVSNAQYAAAQGLSAIAVSADANTTGDAVLAAEAAQLMLPLLDTLKARSHGGSVLPKGVALNVNYPKFTAGKSAGLDWAPSHQGTYSTLNLKFVADLSQDPVAQASGLGSYAYPGLTFSYNTAPPTKDQAEDEAAVVASGKISVTVMQVGFDANVQTQRWVQRELGSLFNNHCDHKGPHKACD